MVDFNSEQLFTANKGEILNIIILGRRDELINSFQLWHESVISNSSSIKSNEYKLRGGLFALFLELEQPLSRNLDKKIFESLKNFIYSKDDVKDDDLIKHFQTINEFLDKIKLIKIDTKKHIDSRLVEDENEDKGL